MSDDALDQDAWLARIGYRGPRARTLETLAGLVTAQAMSIAYESIDVLLDRPPRLDLASLQSKLVAGGRGGYCFELNMMFRAGLLSLGFSPGELRR